MGGEDRAAGLLLCKWLERGEGVPYFLLVKIEYCVQYVKDAPPDRDKPQAIYSRIRVCTVYEKLRRSRLYSCNEDQEAGRFPTNLGKRTQDVFNKRQTHTRKRGRFRSVWMLYPGTVV